LSAGEPFGKVLRRDEELDSMSADPVAPRQVLRMFLTTVRIGSASWPPVATTRTPLACVGRFQTEVRFGGGLEGSLYLSAPTRVRECRWWREGWPSRRCSAQTHRLELASFTRLGPWRPHTLNEVLARHRPAPDDSAARQTFRAWSCLRWSFEVSLLPRVRRRDAQECTLPAVDSDDGEGGDSSL
jgi:hypothetical protein